MKNENPSNSSSPIDNTTDNTTDVSDDNTVIILNPKHARFSNNQKPSSSNKISDSSDESDNYSDEDSENYDEYDNSDEYETKSDGELSKKEIKQAKKQIIMILRDKLVQEIEKNQTKEKKNMDNNNDNNHENRMVKKRKTSIDIKREQIKKEIEKINQKDSGNILDRILFSNLPIEKKARLIADFNSSSEKSDNSKYISYINKVLDLPIGVIKPISKNKIPSEFLLQLRKNMDNSIYGHYQTKEEIIDYVSSLFTNPNARGNVLALQSSPGMGKCHAKDTGILMYDGSVKMVQNLEIGDEIMGDDSTPRTVQSLGQGKDVMYEIHHQISGIKYVVNKEHILCIYDINNTIIEISVKDFLRKPLVFQNSCYGYMRSIFFVTKKTPDDPYIQGTLLDTSDDCYKINSFSVRVNYLKGVIDTYGIKNINCVQILLEDSSKVPYILFICRSLGYITRYDIVSQVNVITIKGGYLVYLSYPSLYNAFISKEPIEITELETGEYYGMTLDGNSRYVMDNMIVTHNTKFARALGESLGLPFNQISLGGINDPGILTGHDYTYVGSKPGRMYDSLVKSKCMNPVIYIDECDKIAEGKSTEMNGILTHLLDKEQNMDFKDNYLGDISLDLSKVLFILSFNDEKAIDPVVFNRLKVINIKESTLEEKIQIVKRFTIKEICNNINLDKNKFTISDDTIKYVIQNTDSEPGMRKITRNFETIFNKVNTKMLIENCIEKELIMEGFIASDIRLKHDENNRVIIDNNFVNHYLFKKEPPIYQHMYL